MTKKKEKKEKEKPVDPAIAPSPGDLDPKTNPADIEITAVQSTGKAIKIWFEHNGEPRFVGGREVPRKAFSIALNDLRATVCEVMETGADWKKNLRIVGFDLKGLGGGQAISIHYQKGMDKASKVQAASMPFALVTNPSTQGTYSEVLGKKHLNAVEEAIGRSKDYLLGDREQMLLQAAIKDEEAQGEDPNQEQIPGTEDK